MPSNLTPLDVAELLGIALALVLAASLGSGPSLALLLGTLLGAHFFVRHLRRGPDRPRREGQR